MLQTPCPVDFDITQPELAFVDKIGDAEIHLYLIEVVYQRQTFAVVSVPLISSLKNLRASRRVEDKHEVVHAVLCGSVLRGTESTQALLGRKSTLHVRKPLPRARSSEQQVSVHDTILPP